MEKSFLKVLFENSFSEFITRRVTRVIYTVYIVVLSLYTGLAIMFGVSLLTQEETFLGLLVIAAAPVSALLLLILGRLGFEAGIALVLIAENTQKMAERSRIDER